MKLYWMSRVPGWHNFLAVQFQQQHGKVCCGDFQAIIGGEMQILSGGQFRVIYGHAVNFDPYTRGGGCRDGKFERKRFFAGTGRRSR